IIVAILALRAAGGLATAQAIANIAAAFLPRATRPPPDDARPRSRRARRAAQPHAPDPASHDLAARRIGAAARRLRDTATGERARRRRECCPAGPRRGAGAPRLALRRRRPPLRQPPACGAAVRGRAAWRGRLPG